MDTDSLIEIHLDPMGVEKVGKQHNNRELLTHKGPPLASAREYQNP